MTSEAPATETILVADDDVHIVELVSLYLRRAGYSVEAAYDGSQALRKATEVSPALLVLDIMMPGEDGLQVCRALRRRGNTPIVFLSARSSDIDKIAGLRIGADDYVTKPFNPDELVARVEAVLRRSRRPGAAQPDRLALGDVEVDVAARLARFRGESLQLTPKELDLLVTLMRFPGVSLDREQLLDFVWGTTFYAMRTVDVHIARLREKLRGSRLQIDTVWGTGYRLGVADP